MDLQEFLEIVEGSDNAIINLEKKEAIKAVKQEGYALQYVDRKVFASNIDKKEQLLIELGNLLKKYSK